MKIRTGRTGRRAALTLVVSAALVLLAGAPMASAASVGRCSAWKPVQTVIVRNDVLVTVNSALRVRSCTNVVGYTGKYKGRKRAAVRVTGTAQVWNTNPKSGPPVAVPVSVLTTITDYGVKRVSKFYFRAVNPGAVASYSTTVTAWNVKGRSATTAAQAVNGDSAADWARTSSSWRH